MHGGMRVVFTVDVKFQICWMRCRPEVHFSLQYCRRKGGDDQIHKRQALSVQVEVLV